MIVNQNNFIVINMNLYNSCYWFVSFPSLTIFEDYQLFCFSVFIISWFDIVCSVIIFNIIIVFYAMPLIVRLSIRMKRGEGQDTHSKNNGNENTYLQHSAIYSLAIKIQESSFAAKSLCLFYKRDELCVCGQYVLAFQLYNYKLTLLERSRVITETEIALNKVVYFRFYYMYQTFIKDALWF